MDAPPVMPLDIFPLTIGPDRVRTYVTACRRTGQCAVIDPGGDTARLCGLIAENGLSARYILNTHGHGDHVLGNRDLKTALNVPVCMHGKDEDFFGGQFNQADARIDIRLAHGDRLPLGECTVQVIHTPGHTPGSVCFLSGNHLFTGDTLFVGDAGRTDLPGGSLTKLVASLEKHIISLPEDTVIWPGHDYGETPTSTIGREKRENPYITDFILDP